MEIDKIKLNSIEPADYNPRKISDEDKNKLRNSLTTFGLVDPIIINLNNNRIIGGHQRYQVLLEMSEESEDLENKDYTLIKKGDIGFILDIDDLELKNEDYEKALNLALNKISGEWDNEKLAPLLEELELSELDIELTGFEVDDLNDMFTFKDSEELIDSFFEPIESEYSKEEIEEKRHTFHLIEGEQWKFGNHILSIGEVSEDDKFYITIDFKDMVINFKKVRDSFEFPFEDFLKDNKDNKGINYTSR